MVEEVAALSVRLEADIDRLEAGLRRAMGAVGRSAAVIERRAQGMDQRLSAVGARFGVGLAARLVTIGGALALTRKGFNDLISASDRTRLLTGRFEALTGSAERAAQNMQAVFDIATRTSSPIDTVGDALAKFTAVADSIGATDEQLQQMTENLLKLGQIGGATTNELNSGLLQLAQGFGAGRLAGDEFKTVNEAMPLVIRRIARELGVLPGEVKQLAADGEITADVMLRALGGAAEDIAEQFEKLPVTFGRATQRMSTAWTRFLAEIGKNQEIGAAVDSVAAALDSITDKIEFTDQVRLDGIVAEIARVEANSRSLEAAIRDAQNEAVDLMASEVELNRTDLASGAIEQVEQLQRELQDVKDRLEFLNNLEVEVRVKLLRLGPDPIIDPVEGPEGFARELVKRVPKPKARPGTTGNPIDLRENEPAFEEADKRRGRQSTADIDEAARFIDQLRERVELLQQDQQLAGRSRAAQAQLTAEFERQRIVKDFLAGIQRKGIAATPEEIAQVEALAQAYRDESVALAVLNDVLETEADKQREAERAAEEHRLAIQRIGDAISGAIIQADSFSDALKNVAVALSNIVLQKGADLLSSSLTKGLGALIGGLGGGSSGGTGTGGFPLGTFEAAKGAAFDRGHLVPFARGGIVDRPTIFPMANGAGLMGEAGPEAVLPLKRGPGGRLGVEGGGRANVTVQIVNNTPAEVREDAPQRGPNGDEVRRFIIGEVKKATVRGDLDTEQRGRFGISPQRIRR